MSKDPKDALESIDAFMIAQILSTPDEEVLAEMLPDDEARIKAALERAQQVVGKEKLTKARAELDAARGSTKVVRFSRDRAARHLASLLAADRGLKGKITLAARNASGESSEDDEGLLEDIDELFRDDDAEGR